MNLNLSPHTASFALVLGCILFGLGSLIVAHVSLGAYAMAFWRLFIAAGIFFTLCVKFKISLIKTKKARIYAFISGVFLGFDLALWHESIYAVGPGISTLLNSLQIFWLTFIGVFYFHERLNFVTIARLFLASCGVFLIAIPEFSINLQATWGFISGVLSGVCLAFSMIFIKKTHEFEEPHIFSLMFFISLGGAIALILPSFALNHENLLPANLRELTLVIIYGAVMQCVAWGLIAYSVPLLSLSLVGLLLLSEPVAAILIDAFLLGKNINLAQYIGVIITMTAIYFGSLKRR